MREKNLSHNIVFSLNNLSTFVYICYTLKQISPESFSFFFLRYFTLVYLLNYDLSSKNKLYLTWLLSTHIWIKWKTKIPHPRICSKIQHKKLVKRGKIIDTPTQIHECWESLVGTKDLAFLGLQWTYSFTKYTKEVFNNQGCPNRVDQYGRWLEILLHILDNSHREGIPMFVCLRTTVGQPLGQLQFKKKFYWQFTLYLFTCKLSK